jgi:ClpP class serine protease
MKTEGGLCSLGMRSFAEAIQAANKDSAISSILISADTGGGQVLAGQIAANAVKESKKPILFHADFLGSAGYMAAMYADEIWAAGNFTEIGSIGVMSTVDKEWLGLYAKYYEDVYASTSADKNQEFKSLLNGNAAPLISKLDIIDAEFMSAVKDARQLKADSKAESTLAGGMFAAKEAIDRGLIDNIGSYEAAVQYAASMRGKKNKKDKVMDFKSTKLGALLAGFFSLEPEAQTQEAFTSEANIIAEKFNAIEAAQKATEEKIEQSNLRILSLEAEKVKMSEDLASANIAISELQGTVSALKLENETLKAEKALLEDKLTEANAKIAAGRLTQNARTITNVLDASDLKKRADGIFSIPRN